MTLLDKIKKPSLLLDETRCRNNIGAMASKARSSRVNFRPHFKTHQSATIGEWFRDEGVVSITVSSVTMANHFVSHGWNDLTIAFPLNLREAGDINSLMKKVKVNILAANSEHLSLMKNIIRNEAGCFIKINTGNNRSGTDWDDEKEMAQIARVFSDSKYLHMEGLLTHAGHAYKSVSREEIVNIYNDTLSKLQEAKKLFPGGAAGMLTSGDTPSCSVVENFKGLDEIRPGNFVFYDLMQFQLGSCSRDQIAVAVACPVVEKNIRKREIIIYGGGVHLSKDSLRLGDGRNVFGQIVLLDENGWRFPDEDVYLRSISQEHGIISAPGSFFDRLQPGDLAGVIPVHSCMTADLLREYHLLDGRVISDFSPK
jgi:D-serine deaminase-like pyridoxal phosphate-dependent protein